MSYHQTLIERLKNRQAVVGIIGLGYVGLPLAVEFAEAGFNVIGLDLSSSKVDQLNSGVSYIPDITTERIHHLVANGKLRATTSYEELRMVDTISICVPTPLRKTKDPDMSYVISAMNSITAICHDGMLIVLESTTYPGTTEELIIPQLENAGFKAGETIFVAFSPERIDPGNKTYQVRNTPKVIGGATPDCTTAAMELYSAAVDQIIPVSSPTSAEMVKLLENTFRSVNIGLVNEMALMCNKLGIDVWEIIHAAASKPFGFMPFYPGPGLGGHCIPIDPLYLSWKLKTLNYNARFIELASEINTQMPVYVVNRIADALNDDAKSVRGSNIVIVGVAYKKDIDDVRESPAIDVAVLLQNRGANVSYHDPYVSQVRLDETHNVQQLAETEKTIYSSEFSVALLESADCVVVITDHNWYDWQYILDHSHLVIDTRNATRGLVGKARIVTL